MKTVAKTCAGLSALASLSSAGLWVNSATLQEMSTQMAVETTATVAATAVAPMSAASAAHVAAMAASAAHAVQALGSSSLTLNTYAAWASAIAGLLMVAAIALND